MRQLTAYLFGLLLLLNLVNSFHSSAQNSNIDSLLKDYSKNIIGTWVRQDTAYYKAFSVPGLKKDSVHIYFDTLKIMDNKQFYWREFWSTDSGSWKIVRSSDLPAVTTKRDCILELITNNVALSDNFPVLPIVHLSKMELSYESYPKVRIYKRAN